MQQILVVFNLYVNSLNFILIAVVKQYIRYVFFLLNFSLKIFTHMFGWNLIAKNNACVRKRTFIMSGGIVSLQMQTRKPHNIWNLFTNSAPLGRVGHIVAISMVVSVCLSVPLRNTHFRRSCRPLVEDRVPNIGLGRHKFQKKGGV